MKATKAWRLWKELRIQNALGVLPEFEDLADMIETLTFVDRSIFCLIVLGDDILHGNFKTYFNKDHYKAFWWFLRGPSSHEEY